MLAYCLKVSYVRFVACLSAWKSAQAWPKRSDFDFRFASISHAGPFQNVTTEVTEICRDYTLLTPDRHEQVL